MGACIAVCFCLVGATALQKFMRLNIQGPVNIKTEVLLPGEPDYANDAAPAVEADGQPPQHTKIRCFFQNNNEQDVVIDFATFINISDPFDLDGCTLTVSIGGASFTGIMKDKFIEKDVDFPEMTAVSCDGFAEKPPDAPVAPKPKRQRNATEEKAKGLNSALQKRLCAPRAQP